MKAPPGAENGETAGTFWTASRNFGQLPLSQETKEGLKNAKYKAMTAIQRAVSWLLCCQPDLPPVGNRLFLNP